MLDLMKLNQTIAQIIQCDIKVFWMTLGDVLGVAAIIIFFMLTKLSPLMASALKDDSMQIDKMRFKPFMEQENQWWTINKLCLYCE